MNGKPITVIIADDHPIFRAGLSHVINDEEDISLVAEASNGEELLSLIEQYKPQIVLTDIDMPKKSGIDVAEVLRNKPSPPKIIFLTLYDDEDFFNKAMDMGVNGFLLKENATNDVIAAIKAVAEGNYFLTPSVSNLLIKRSEGGKNLEKEIPGLVELTVSERKILRLIAEGKTTKEISDSLYISTKTVESHRTNIFKKLNLGGSHALVKFAIANKNSL